MSSIAAPPPTRNRPLRLTYAAVVLTVLLIVSSPLAIRWHAVSSAERHLTEAIAEADRLDPGWRLEDLIAKQEAVPDGENLALVIRKVADLKPKEWLNRPGLDFAEEQLLHPAPCQLPTERLHKVLRDEMARASAALTEAEKIIELTRGHPAWSHELTDTKSGGDLTAFHRVSNLLVHDAVLRAHEGDMDAALLRCLGVLNTGRAMGETPSSLGQLIRNGRAVKCADHAELVLSLGQPSPAVLLRLQKELQAERDRPALVLIMRANRAETFAYMHGPYAMKLLDQDEAEEDRWTRWAHVLRSDQAFIDENLARHMERSSSAVELAKVPAGARFSPWRERRAEREQIEKVEGREKQFWRLISSDDKLAIGVLKPHANLDCAILALAAERYRLTHGRWPEKLEQFVPEFMPRIPDDPFGTGPFRLAKLDDGIVIYSVGQDETDNGGKLDPSKSSATPGTDFGFRLWNHDKRRQLPLPKGEEEKP